MKTQIKSQSNGEVLYEGFFCSTAQALEQACTADATISGANISGQNLQNINLDGAKLKDINFSGTNMCGANMSEATIENCNFSGAYMPASCFAYSTIINCNFEYCTFGGTDIAGATLQNNIFSGTSWAYLNFYGCAKIKDCRFLSEHSTTQFSVPPLVMLGLDSTPVILFEDHFMWKKQLVPHQHDHQDLKL